MKQALILVLCSPYIAARSNLTEDANKALAYRRAIAYIKLYPKEIESAEEARKIPYVGKKTAEKVRTDEGMRSTDSLLQIDEILRYGVLSRVLETQKREDIRTRKLFRKVFGTHSQIPH